MTELKILGGLSLTSTIFSPQLGNVSMISIIQSPQLHKASLVSTVKGAQLGSVGMAVEKKEPAKLSVRLY